MFHFKKAMDHGGSLVPIAGGITSIVFNLPYSNWQKDSAAMTINTVILKSYAGAYEYNADHKLIVTFMNGSLFIEDTNPKDKLPRVQLYALNDNTFYMKKAQLKFNFIRDGNGDPLKLVTYITEDKKEEWKKIK